MAFGGGGMVRMLQGYVEISARDKMKGGIGLATRRLNEFSGRVRSAAFATGALAAGTAAAVAPAVMEFANFDDQMRELQARLGGVSANEMADLREQVRQLGAETSFTAQQVGSAATELAKAGLAADEVSGALEHVLALSRATGAELPRAAEMVAKSMRIFKMETEDAQEIADVLTATVNNSTTNIEDLWEALSYAGPEAKAAGQSLQTTAAILGVMANQGIEASRAGTDVRRAMKALTDETKRSKIFNQLGVDTLDAKGEIRDFVVVLKEMRAAMDQRNWPGGRRAAFYTEVFGLRTESARLIGENADAFAELNQKLRDATGLAAETQRAMDAGLGGGIRMLLSAVNDLNIELGKILAGPLTGVMAIFKSGIVIVREFAKANQMLVVGVVGLIGAFVALAAVLLVVSLGLLAIGSLLQAIAILNIPALVMAAAPLLPFIGSLIAAFGALAFVALGFMWSLNSALNSSMPTFKALRGVLGEIVDMLAQTFEMVSIAARTDGLGAAAYELVEGLKSAVTYFAGWLMTHGQALIIEWAGHTWLGYIKYSMTRMIPDLLVNSLRTVTMAWRWTINPLRDLMKNITGTKPAVPWGLRWLLESGWERAQRRFAKRQEELAAKQKKAADQRKRELREQLGMQDDVTDAALAASLPGYAAAGTFSGMLAQRIQAQPVTLPLEEANAWLEKIYNALARSQQDQEDIKNQGVELKHST